MNFWRNSINLLATLWGDQNVFFLTSMLKSSWQVFFISGILERFGDDQKAFVVLGRLCFTLRPDLMLHDGVLVPG